VVNITVGRHWPIGRDAQGSFDQILQSKKATPYGVALREY